MSYWYQSTNNNRHPKIKSDTYVRTRKEGVTLKAGTVVQPVRNEFISTDCWVFENDSWCKNSQVVCYTEQYGMVIVKLEDIDFSR